MTSRGPLGTCTYDRFRLAVGDPRGGIRTGPWYWLLVLAPGTGLWSLVLVYGAWYWIWSLVLDMRPGTGYEALILDMRP